MNYYRSLQKNNWGRLGEAISNLLEQNDIIEVDLINKILNYIELHQNQSALNKKNEQDVRMKYDNLY